MKIKLCAAMMLLGVGLAAAQTEATPSSAAKTNPLAASRVFPYDQMTVTKAANGTEGRRVFAGTLATGETVSVHESTQPAGTPPVNLHKISHSELIVVTEGTVDFEHDGKDEQVGPGGVVYVAYGTVHRIKNLGKVPAKYVVIAIGGDAVK